MNAPENLTPVDIASYVSASALAATKLIVAFRPFWAKMPRWLSISLPVLVLDLPLVAQYFTGVTTGAGLFTAFVTSLALVLPGVAEAEKKDGQKNEGASPTDVDDL